jgi:hypothetical protein
MRFLICSKESLSMFLLPPSLAAFILMKAADRDRPRRPRCPPVLLGFSSPADQRTIKSSAAIAIIRRGRLRELLYRTLRQYNCRALPPSAEGNIGGVWGARGREGWRRMGGMRSADS